MTKSRILIIEDDAAVRKMMSERLRDDYEVFGTGNPTEALALALEHKPDCILLDLMMPRFSGLELCQTFSSVSLTQMVPIFVISGQSALDHREHCLNLGAKEYFEKPLNFTLLKERLTELFKGPRQERRIEPRIRLKVIVKLVGKGRDGKEFELLACTEDVSVSGFQVRCSLPLAPETLVEVFLMKNVQSHRVGTAALKHMQFATQAWQTCGFKFVDKQGAWVL